MATMRRTGRAILTFAAGLLVLMMTMGTANASPTRQESALADRGSAVLVDPGTAACPVPGQRVKVSNDPRVFLIDPAGYVLLIPNETTYFNLWDSWNGIVTNNSLWSCTNGGTPINFGGSVLISTPNGAVYIWDPGFGKYRWIVSAATFNKYAFSWGKIIPVSWYVTSPGPQWT